MNDLSLEDKVGTHTQELDFFGYVESLADTILWMVQSPQFLFSLILVVLSYTAYRITKSLYRVLAALKQHRKATEQAFQADSELIRALYGSGQKKSFLSEPNSLNAPGPKPIQANSAKKLKDLPDSELERSIRLDELRSRLEIDELYAKRFKALANSLVFGQYIVGGILATAFIQQNFSPNFVGIFGVIVLSSSLINQRFKPQYIASRANERAFKARSAIRRIEDNLFNLKRDEQFEKNVKDMRNLITEQLELLDHHDLRSNHDNVDLPESD